MPNFRYEARAEDGEIVTGNLEAESVQAVVVELQERGMFLHSIQLDESERMSSSEAGANAVRGQRTAPRRFIGESVEQGVLRTHMATILERGREISPALAAYAEEMPPGWQRRELQAVCGILDRAEVSEATAQLSKLPEYWIPLLTAATSSSDPGHVLHEFLTESNSNEELRHKWWLTLAYPLFIFALAAVVMTTISMMIIPEFREMFDEFNIELPSVTKWIIVLGQFLSRWGGWIIAGCVGLLIIVTLYAQRIFPPTLRWFSEYIRLPFGRRTAVARFARFAADLLEAGVSLPDALRVAGFAVNQSGVQQAAWRLANDLELTGEFSQRAYERPLTATIAYAFSPSVTPATRIRLLRELSECHAERVRHALSWTGGVVEPLAICAVGIVVGFTVIALFMPLFNLVEGLSM